MVASQQEEWQLVEGKMQLMKQLQLAIPEAGVAELASLLQLEVREVPGKKEKRDTACIPVRLRHPGGSDATSNQDYPPKIKNIPFLYHHGFELKEQQEGKTETPNRYTMVDFFRGKIVSAMGAEIDPEPLTTWAQIWPVLHSFFSRSKTTNRLDEQQIIRKAVKQQPILHIPWRKKKCWSQEVVLLADYSPHLSPYFKDYLGVMEKMRAWFRDRLHLVICVDSEAQRFLYQGQSYGEFPIKGENLYVLYLGDLGFLDQQGISSACYYFLGQELCRRYARIEALLTVHPSDYDQALGRYFHFHHWDSGICADSPVHNDLSRRGGVRRQQSKELLTALSLAFEVNPALVRKMRIYLGQNVSVESLLLQEDALRGNGLSYQWRSEEIRKEYSDRLKKLPVDPDGLWQIIELFESRLPLELQVEQRQKSGKDLSPVQQEFVRRLVKSQRQKTLTAEDEELLFGWLERMAKRSGQEIWQKEMSELYFCYWDKKRPVAVPAGIDLTRMPQWISQAEDEQWLSMRQLQDKICFSAAGEKGTQETEMPCIRANSHGQLFIVSLGCRQKYSLPFSGELQLPDELEEIRIETETEKHTIKTMVCPVWASAIGRDRYGLFTEIRVETVRFVMRWIAPGRFLMGSPDDEPERYSYEGPEHEVEFTEGFWLAETSCTQELWQAVMGENPSRFSNDPQNPVENVERGEVLKFIGELNSRLSGLNLRLPSEAEWEYGCRAGTTTPFWFGEELSRDKANYNGSMPYNKGSEEDSSKSTVPVKMFQANPWGLYQMHGNVWELCQDFWHADYVGAPTDGSVWEGGDEARAVYRGGSWIDDGRFLRSACRSRWRFAIGSDGFRLARGPERKGQGSAGRDRR